MKLKFHIPEPCSEDWSKMSSTEKGAFCDKCQTEVRDYTQTPTETIRSERLNGKHSCVRILQHQLDELNFFEWYDHLALSLRNRYLMLFAMIFMGTSAQAQDSQEFVSIDSVDLSALQTLIAAERNNDSIYPEAETTPFLILSSPYVWEGWGGDIVVSGGPMVIEVVTIYGGWSGFLAVYPVTIEEEARADKTLSATAHEIGLKKEENPMNQIKLVSQPLKEKDPKEGNPFDLPMVGVPFRRRFYGKSEKNHLINEPID